MDKKKILIIDDNSSVRSSLSKLILQSFSNIETFVAESGSQGIEIYEREKTIDLIFTDYRMPDMNGLAMCKILKGKYGKALPPIIMLTTESNKDIMAEGKTVGITAWILKPISAKTLNTYLEKILN